MRLSHLAAATASALAVLLFAMPAGAHGPASAHVAELTRSLAAHPDDAALWLERAEFQHADAHFAEALADLDRAAALAPALARVDFVRGRVLSDAGAPAEAAIALERYALRTPEDGEGWALLGRVRARLGRDAAAAIAFDRAIDTADPPSPDFYLDRARALERQGPAFGAERARGLREGIARLGPAPALVGELAAAEGRDRDAAIEASIRASRVSTPRTGAVRLSRDAATPLPPTIDATLTRGPYLQTATRTGITIRWRTGTATDSRVRWGPAPGDLPNVADLPALTTEHVVPITGLDAGTRYYYSVGSAAEPLAGDATTFFWTLPDTSFTGPTRLWAIGDSGIPGVNQNAVRDAYLAWSGGARTHLWLMLGDNAYQTGTDAEYQASVFTPYASLLRNQCLWPTRGNHDVIHSGSNNDYYDHFSLPSSAESGGVLSATEAYYAVDYGNLHLVCLDSEGSSLALGSAMRVWLRSDLLANTRPWVIAYWHHPPYTKGSHDSDDAADSGGRMRDMRQNFVSLLDSLGVDLVLSGHSHSYERSMLLRGHYGISTTLTSAMKADSGDGRRGGDGAYHKPSPGPGPMEGAVHSVVGSSSQISAGSLDHPVMIASLGTLGSLAVDVTGNRLDAHFIDDAGVVRDSFAIEKGGNVAVGPRPATPLALSAPRPNPSRGASRFDFMLPRSGAVRLTVMAAGGQRVATVISGVHAAGRHTAEWDGRDARGRLAPAGIYFAVLEAGGGRLARRFVRVH